MMTPPSRIHHVNKRNPLNDAVMSKSHSPAMQCGMIGIDDVTALLYGSSKTHHGPKMRARVGHISAMILYFDKERLLLRQRLESMDHNGVTNALQCESGEIALSLQAAQQICCVEA
ncbi:hypothetical protein [Roseinatronobacter monicus]|uniref:Uncharacterized protein n=1 Tax=Roseinatronobacter monicus TaxID=393481 RepID=A0A543K5I7_9RHOB|nr:hypothetical protein [Roseinatronobacter monicus]TQM90348.1 hypothetical protein BD293_3725 [Roseinatronobacter monicus]